MTAPQTFAYILASICIAGLAIDQIVHILGKRDRKRDGTQERSKRPLDDDDYYTDTCDDCHHFFNKEPDSPRYGCWYNRLCGAGPFPENKSILDSQTQLPYCYHIKNGDGTCDKFKSKVVLSLR